MSLSTPLHQTSRAHVPLRKHPGEALLSINPDLTGMDLNLGTLEDVERTLCIPHMMPECGFYLLLSLQPPWKGHCVFIISAHISWELKIVPKEPKPSFPVTQTSLKGMMLFLSFVMLELHTSS